MGWFLLSIRYDPRDVPLLLATLTAAPFVSAIIGLLATPLGVHAFTETGRAGVARLAAGGEPAVAGDAGPRRGGGVAAVVASVPGGARSLAGTRRGAHPRVDRQPRRARGDGGAPDPDARPVRPAPQTAGLTTSRACSPSAAPRHGADRARTPSWRGGPQPYCSDPDASRESFNSTVGSRRGPSSIGWPKPPVLRPRARIGPDHPHRGGRVHGRARRVPADVPRGRYVGPSWSSPGSGGPWSSSSVPRRRRCVPTS